MNGASARILAPAIAARSLAVERGHRALLDDVSIELYPGTITTIIGANGVGKSTLVRALAGELTATRGAVEVDGRAATSWSRTELARRVAFLHQDHAIPFGFTVREVVEMGRYPWVGTPAERRDAAVVDEVLEETQISALANRRLETLSGGERARAMLARVLAQDTPTVLLDEPAAAFDLGRASLLFELLSRRAHRGACVAVVSHDIATASTHADVMCLLAEGRLVATGPAEFVCKSAVLSSAFGLPVAIAPSPFGVGVVVTSGASVNAVPESITPSRRQLA